MTTSSAHPVSFLYPYLHPPKKTNHSIVSPFSETKGTWKTKEKRTSELNPQHPLQLPQDLRVRDRPAGLVVLQDGRLLVDLLRYVFLRELQVEAGLGHGLWILIWMP